LNAFGLWVRDTGVIYENGTHAVLNTTECSDYYSVNIQTPYLEFRQTQFIYSSSDSQAIYTIGFTNSYAAQWRVVFQFNNDGKVYYSIQKYPSGGLSGLLTTVTNKSIHDYKLAYFENGNFRFYIDDQLLQNITDSNYLNPMPEYRYIWLDIQGYGAANPTNRLFINSVLNYTTFDNISYTFKFWNYTSTSYKTYAGFYDDLTNWQLSKDFFNNTNIKMQFYMNYTQSFVRTIVFTLKITYFYLTNKTYYYYYVLNPSTLYYFYSFTLLSTLKGNTSTTFRYQTSSNNATWDSWSSSVAISAFKNRYLHYRIDCNTTNGWNYSQFNAANLYFQYRNISCYYILDLLQTAFIAPVILKNVTLQFQVASQITNLLNSSVNVYKFSTSTWQNLSSINQFCSFNVTSN
jgi:hypothetical protein